MLESTTFYMNIFSKVTKYLREVRSEMTKVTWPTRGQTVKMTLMVIVVSVVIGVFIGSLDILLSRIAGAILSFLWFNIPPARFYMGETGILGLTITLAVVAFLTDSVLLLPIIALPLTATALSSAIQITGKKIWGPKGKVFRVAPLHHHFESIGWSREKITMRYWVISVIFAIIGIIIVFIS